MNMSPPPIPATCAGRPTVGGYVAPYINQQLAGGGVDFRAQHQTRLERVLQDSLCQVCAGPLAAAPGLAVLFGGPDELRTRKFDEPPLCVPCSGYTSQACPMIAGRMPRYADRARVSEGPRGHTCPDGACQCDGITPTDPSATDRAGRDAHPWYALFVRATQGAWHLTGSVVPTYCSDRRCDRPHPRQVLNGLLLVADPVKVVLVSEPGAGRVWRRLTPGRMAELLTPYDQIPPMPRMGGAKVTGFVAPTRR